MRKANKSKHKTMVTLWINWIHWVIIIVYIGPDEWYNWQGTMNPMKTRWKTKQDKNCNCSVTLLNRSMDFLTVALSRDSIMCIRMIEEEKERERVWTVEDVDWLYTKDDRDDDEKEIKEEKRLSSWQAKRWK